MENMYKQQAPEYDSASEGKTENKFFETTYDDPEIVLTKVEALSAEFWEGSGKMTSIFSSIVPFTEDQGKTVEF